VALFGAFFAVFLARHQQRRDQNVNANLRGLVHFHALPLVMVL
jgi:hypothetical protein